MSTKHRDETDAEVLAPIDATDSRRALIETEKAKWLTVDDAAYVLGVSRHTLFNMITDGLPVRKSRSTIRIHIEDLRPRAQEVASE